MALHYLEKATRNTRNNNFKSIIDVHLKSAESLFGSFMDCVLVTLNSGRGGLLLVQIKMHDFF